MSASTDTHSLCGAPRNITDDGKMCKDADVDQESDCEVDCESWLSMVCRSR